MKALITQSLVLLCIGFHFYCKQGNGSIEKELPVNGFRILESIPLKEMVLRAKVNQRKGEREYYLEFSKDHERILREYKPNKLRLSLPYAMAKDIFVDLQYREERIVSRFSFPQGLIDSAELKCSFYTKDKYTYPVPVESIYNPFGKSPSVYIVRDGKAVSVPITVQGVHQNLVLVSGDLTEGSIIIKSRLGELFSGLKVGVKL
ncbi:putative lipoprotein [Leptospira ryugenii]|uniref:Putative lipoprotein n=1 Tax=Leptospira ryugenii TaxID=1917863 RepID=A0A2P2DYG6_9LEPT|nr:hypothetical protein [Leptospira ryugenii]GBF49678.1 putative lipoprotein [Leptospira ryugenii]